jgi:TRAP-type C4-dicarboxylate transport system substrate-binding protein
MSLWLNSFLHNYIDLIPVELRLSYPNTETSLSGQSYNYFAQAVEEESNGTIKVTVYPAGSLAANTDILDAIQQGNVDIGHFVATYVSPTIKELTPLEIPGASPSDKYMELDDATHDILDNIFAKYGVKYLVPIEQGTANFVSVKKMIKSPEDYKDLRVRAAGKWIGEAIKQWGGSPVTIPLGDLATSLERGTVDAAYCPWTITGPQKLYETAPNVTFTAIQEAFGGLIMSQKSWDKLNQDQQEAILRAVDRFKEYSINLANEMKEKFRKDMLDANAEIYDLSDAENKAFKEAIRQLIEQSKEIAGPDGEELIKALDAIQ